MNLARLSTQLHKWIALLVAVQVIFWVGGGLVMVVLPIEAVRGEHRVVETGAVALDPGGLVTLQAASEAAAVIPAAATLRSTPRGPVWEIRSLDGEAVIVSAERGARLEPMDEAQARSAAEAVYRGPGRVVAAELLAEAPQETGREGPLWRVTFDDPEGTDFYLNPVTGELVTRRSDLWRVYDLMWRLHIMDLETGEDTNHPLLVAATAVTLSVVVTGLILLWIRLGRDLKAWRRRRSSGSAGRAAGP